MVKYMGGTVKETFLKLLNMIMIEKRTQGLEIYSCHCLRNASNYLNYRGSTFTSILEKNI